MVTYLKIFLNYVAMFMFNIRLENKIVEERKKWKNQQTFLFGSIN
jgi:hypothetical protein